MKEATSKAVKPKQTDSLNLSWRDLRYQRFYAVVDRLVDELQEHVWAKTGKPKRRLKGDGLVKLHYSVECLVRDCMAVVLQRKRKSEAAIRKGQHHYSFNRPDKMLTYSIHIERPCSDDELKTWLSGCPVDLQLYNPIQIHLTANPRFVDGAVDPYPNRSGLFEAGSRESTVPVPSDLTTRTATNQSNDPVVNQDF